MAGGKYVAYYRVSTPRQGRSGLGLDAQRKAVTDYLNGGDWTLLEAFTEVETGKRNDRPQLEAALRHCALTGATLIVAKLDRLSRDAAFLMSLQASNVEIKFADMPFADKMMIGIMALIAEWEREQISKRTKDALAAAKARGTKLGGDRGHTLPSQAAGIVSGEARSEAARVRATQLLHYVREARERGSVTYSDIAKYLNGRGVTTPTGKAWSPQGVRQMVAKHE